MQCIYGSAGEPNGLAIELLFVDFSASGGVSQELTSVATLLTCIRGYALPPGNTTISHVLI